MITVYLRDSRNVQLPQGATVQAARGIVPNDNSDILPIPVLVIVDGAGTELGRFENAAVVGWVLGED